MKYTTGENVPYSFKRIMYKQLLLYMYQSFSSLCALVRLVIEMFDLNALYLST